MLSISIIKQNLIYQYKIKNLYIAFSNREVGKFYILKQITLKSLKRGFHLLSWIIQPLQGPMRCFDNFICDLNPSVFLTADLLLTDNWYTFIIGQINVSSRKADFGESRPFRKYYGGSSMKGAGNIYIFHLRFLRMKYAMPSIEVFPA